MNDEYQGDLFDSTPEARHLARNTDPSTSKLSALHVSTFSGKHHRQIYEALANLNDGTFYEIAEEAGMQPSSVWRRLNELEKAGHIFLTGKERQGPTGRMCRVWTVNQQDKGDAASLAVLIPDPDPIEGHAELSL